MQDFFFFLIFRVKMLVWSFLVSSTAIGKKNSLRGHRHFFNHELLIYFFECWIVNDLLLVEPSDGGSNGMHGMARHDLISHRIKRVLFVQFGYACCLSIWNLMTIVLFIRQSHTFHRVSAKWPNELVCAKILHKSTKICMSST